MLELQTVSLELPNAPEEQLLLTEITARFPSEGHFAAILGPSGCGKSTLLKVIAGLREHSIGKIIWEGRDLVEEGDLAPHEIGYVPQFSIAYDLLTVWESVEGALRLRVAGLDADEREARVEKILAEVGLSEIIDRPVQVLSGGQKRRLALALEMVSSPRLLLCDEVTSGLDPKAEDEIAHLLHALSRDKRIVLSVTHSLRHLSLCDSVIVLYQGHVAYHGAPEFLFHYFGVEKHEDLFPCLAKRKPQDWHRSWEKHREAYYEQSGLSKAAAPASLPAAESKPADTETSDDAEKARLQELFKKLETSGDGAAAEKTEAAKESSEGGEAKPEKEDGETKKENAEGALPGAVSTPSAATQFFVLLARRWKLFLRDRGQLILQLALLFGFPCLVVIFALDGLPQIKSLAAAPGGNFMQQMQMEFSQRSDMMRNGSLVSGLIMFQVVLLALMGSNNAAREIAGERLIFEKEKFAGLNPLAYVLSKASFLAVLVLAQSIWMGVFVNWVVRFPGSLGSQILLLVLVNAALTAISLGISALMRTAEQASLVSIYLVGFQLPLSGAVLALPKVLNLFTRPFIASYWGWSGFIMTLHNTRFYDAVTQVTQTTLSAEALCVWVLLSHVVLGLFLAYMGSRSSRWE